MNLWGLMRQQANKHIMELDLDNISNGSKVWHKVIHSFYKDFKPKVEKLMKSKVKETDKFTRKLGKDPKSGYDIIATIARYGPVVKLLSSKTKPQIAPIKEPLTLDNIKLSRTVCRSNNPHMILRDKYFNYIRLMNENAEKALGIEYEMTVKVGWKGNGGYIYGGLNYEPTIEHIDGRNYK